METRIVKPNMQSNVELDKKLARIMGLEMRHGLYKSMTDGQSTSFTNPPAFSANKRLIPYMLEFANSRGVTIEYGDDPKAIAEEIINKISTK